MSSFFSRELKLGFILAPIAVPIGIVIAYLITTLITGDFGAAFAMIALSIICTAGISLILWIPAWYICGYLFITLLRVVLNVAGIDMTRIFGGKKESQSGQGQAVPSEQSVQALTGQLDAQLQQEVKLSKDELALKNYISKAQTKGLTKEQIAQNLERNGWGRDNIAHIFQLLERGV